MIDLVIGHAVGFSWADIQPYAVSLSRCGFKGKKVLFVKELTDEAMEKLIGLGFELVEISEDLANNKEFLFGAMRHLHVHWYVRHHLKDLRYVFVTDTRDLVFQKDPVEWMENHFQPEKQIVVAPEYISHRNQPWNWEHIKNEFNEVSKWIENKTVCCGGFVAGRAEYMADLCLAVYLTSRSLASVFHGVDQPVLNYVIYQKAWQDITQFPIPHDHFVINCQVAYTPFDQQYHTYWIPPLTDNFVVVHQYDRIPELAHDIRQTSVLAPVCPVEQAKVTDLAAAVEVKS